ncbi:MAG TPA: hypothetical protein PKD90_16045, partial [Phnomibacter sp.]|nr:hypothetical protein [Phnomibacter sp.]
TYMQTQLPACLNNTKVNDLKIANTWLDYLKTYRITPGLKIKWVRQQKLYLHPALYYNILKFFIYQPFRLSVIHELFKGKQPLSQAQ